MGWGQSEVCLGAGQWGEETAGAGVEKEAEMVRSELGDLVKEADFYPRAGVHIQGCALA